MKKIALVIVAFVFIHSRISAQEAIKVETKSPKLSKLQIEIIQSDGYAYAETMCRFEMSKLKLVNNKENTNLQSELEINKLLLYEVIGQGAEKYKELALNTIYMEAYNVGQLKLNTCIRVSKLRAQNELEKIPEK